MLVVGMGDTRHKGIDAERVRVLHGEGLGDRLISQALGCTRTTVLYWRQKLALEACGRGGRPKSAYLKRLARLYGQGATDGAICLQLGCPPSAVLNWRRQRGLGPNFDLPRKSPIPNSERKIQEGLWPASN